MTHSTACAQAQHANITSKGRYVNKMSYVRKLPIKRTISAHCFVPATATAAATAPALNCSFSSNIVSKQEPCVVAEEKVKLNYILAL